jgi:predicted O-methyltransferase YrrM
MPREQPPGHSAHVARAVRGLADRCCPPWLTELRSRRWLAREVRTLKNAIAAATTLDAVVDAVCRSEAFRAEQQRTEITGFLQLLESERPQRLLEIGGRRGGTLALFAAAMPADARLLSLDMAYSRAQRALNPRLARPGQLITCAAMDSHSPATPEFVREWLGGAHLDVLFVDGDHSLKGVSRDLLMYGPLLRPDGIVAFHDIVQDLRSRTGESTEAYAGEVPEFWAQVKRRTNGHIEFIEHPRQDGCGIGVVRWTGSLNGWNPCAES